MTGNDWFFQDDRSSQRDIISNAVRDRNLGNISFNKAQGGTLVLGGTNNTNGSLSVKDSTNTEKIILDKDGLVIHGGKITIYNDSDVTTLDSKGIVSTANFASGNTVSTSTRTLQSKTLADLASTTLTFSLTRTSRVLLSATIICNMYNLGSTDSIIGAAVYMNVDGANESNFMHTISGPIAYNGGFETISPTATLTFNQIKSLAAGSHTIKLQWQVTFPVALPGTEGVTTSNTSVLYIVLGT